MFLEICMQSHSVVFALSRHINKKKYAKTINLLCAGNNVFVKYQAQGGVLPKNPPCVRPWSWRAINYPLYDGIHGKRRLHMRATHASAQSSPKVQVYTTGVNNLSLTMYPFSISIDEHVHLKFPMTKGLSKIPKIYWIFNRTFRIFEI